MTHKTIVMLAVLVLAACSKDRDTAGTTTTTGAGLDRQTPVEEVRMVMITERPESAAAIDAFRITNENGVVTLRGRVDDEETRMALVNRVRRMSGVKEVMDELSVVPPKLHDQPGGS